MSERTKEKTCSLKSERNNGDVKSPLTMNKEQAIRFLELTIERIKKSKHSWDIDVQYGEIFKSGEWYKVQFGGKDVSSS
jgi:hypothetical protein